MPTDALLGVLQQARDSAALQQRQLARLLELAHLLEQNLRLSEKNIATDVLSEVLHPAAELFDSGALGNSGSPRSLSLMRP